MSVFIDTPFNKDCPHHKLYFTTKPERCPYCGVLSHAAVKTRLRKVLIWVGIAVAAGWWALR